MNKSSLTQRASATESALPLTNRNAEPMAVLGAVVIMAAFMLGLTGQLGATDDGFEAQAAATAAAASSPVAY